MFDDVRCRRSLKGFKFPCDGPKMKEVVDQIVFNQKKVGPASLKKSSLFYDQKKDYISVVNTLRCYPKAKFYLGYPKTCRMPIPFDGGKFISVYIDLNEKKPFSRFWVVIPLTSVF